MLYVYQTFLQQFLGAQNDYSNPQNNYRNVDQTFVQSCWCPKLLLQPQKRLQTCLLDVFIVVLGAHNDYSNPKTTIETSIRGLLDVSIIVLGHNEYFNPKNDYRKTSIRRFQTVYRRCETVYRRLQTVYRRFQTFYRRFQNNNQSF